MRVVFSFKQSALDGQVELESFIRFLTESAITKNQEGLDLFDVLGHGSSSLFSVVYLNETGPKGELISTVEFTEEGHDLYQKWKENQFIAGRHALQNAVIESISEAFGALIGHCEDKRKKTIQKCIEDTSMGSCTNGIKINMNKGIPHPRQEEYNCIVDSWIEASYLLIEKAGYFFDTDSVDKYGFVTLIQLSNSGTYSRTKHTNKNCKWISKWTNSMNKSIPWRPDKNNNLFSHLSKP